MTKKIIMGIVLASAFMFMGCGGGGGSSTPPAPVVDNSVLADGQNSYGYYGKNVIFGSSIIYGAWSMEATIDGTYENVDLIFYSNGRYYTSGDNAYGNYGVSSNGQVLQDSVGDYTTISKSLGNDCYTLTIDYNGNVLNNARFCRTGSLSTEHTVLIMHSYPKDVCESNDLYNTLNTSATSNLVIKSYSDNITCSDFQTSESTCHEHDSALSYDTACVIESDLDVVSTSLEESEYMALDALNSEL